MEGGEARIVAYTKVFAIRARLDKRVRYITDGEKTSLASSITYISNPEKTEQFFFTSVLNCSSVDTALSEMMETKQQFGKMGGVLGYHFIQSFQPGEVTPEQAHAVGLEFAKRLFGKRYEVVISTHLNKHHLHNHLVVNSVSCMQHSHCTNISWADAQPGDLVFYPDNSHVGIVGGRDTNGELLIIHCASGYNNVVITGKEGFASIGRPQYYSD